MRRLALLFIVLGLAGSGVSHAEEANLCSSLCASQKKECRANALEATENDTSPLIEIEDKNPYARAAARGQVVAEVTRSTERANFQKRKQERFSACETRFQQCSRGCAPSDSSVVLKRPARTQ